MDGSIPRTTTSRATPPSFPGGRGAGAAGDLRGVREKSDTVRAKLMVFFAMIVVGIAIRTPEKFTMYGFVWAWACLAQWPDEVEDTHRHIYIYIYYVRGVPR